MKLNGLNVALLLDAVCHYKAYRQTEPAKDEEEQKNKEDDIKTLTEIETELKERLNEEITKIKKNEDFNFDTWLENQPEGTFVQGGGIDK